MTHKEQQAAFYAYSICQTLLELDVFPDRIPLVLSHLVNEMWMLQEHELEELDRRRYDLIKTIFQCLEKWHKKTDSR